MANKKTDLIRIKEEDKKIWREYCKSLGESSPVLFNRIMRSQTLNINQKILEELRIKEEVLKKKIDLQYDKKSFKR